MPFHEISPPARIYIVKKSSTQDNTKYTIHQHNTKYKTKTFLQYTNSKNGTKHRNKGT